MATLILARHGETDWNRDHRWQGFTGPSLNDEGRRQATELAARLDHLDAIYNSDLERARETAAIVGTRLGVAITADARLREVNFGDWEGLRSDEIERRYPNDFHHWAAGEGSPQAGESDEEMAKRVLQAVNEIAEAHDEGRVLVVTHGGPIRAVQAHLHGIEQPKARRLLRTVSHCALVELVIRDGMFEDTASSDRPV